MATMIQENDTHKETTHAEGMSQLYEQSFKKIKEQEVVKGKVIAMNDKEVLIDIGHKSEGRVAREEFADVDDLKMGDEVEVFIESLETKDGMISLSRRKAKVLTGWEKFVAKYKESDVISGKVVRKVKGGLMVDIGLEAFLPGSQAYVKNPQEFDELVGKRYDFMILKINHQRKNVVLSRKEAVLAEKGKQKDEFFASVQVGQVVEGTVKNITNFGVFVNLGPIDGLLYITDLSWGRVGHPQEVVSVGDPIKVQILSKDENAKRLSLGLKQLQPNPWDEVDKKYPVSSRVKAKVVNIVPYGAFVEIEKGLEGLVHVSELSWTKRVGHPKEMLSVGDELEVVVIGIDKESQRLSLSIRQTTPDPWEEIVAGFPVGTKTKATIVDFIDIGAVVALDKGVEALLHTSDISWTRRIASVEEVFKKQDQVDVIVISTDKDSRKIFVGVKQLTPDPWPEIAKKYLQGTVLEAEVTKVTNFGIFVKLEQDLEGLVHISEMRDDVASRLHEAVNPGDMVKVKVLKVDESQHKIALSMREL